MFNLVAEKSVYFVDAGDGFQIFHTLDIWWELVSIY